MIAYLKSDAATKPAVVDAASDAGTDGEVGLVTSTIAHGELFLRPKGRKAELFRLRWAPDDEARARPVPVGVYPVIGYRHIQKAADGAPWIWSSCSNGFRELEVKSDETVACDVKTGLKMNTRALFRKGKHRVGLLFMAAKKLGHTLYRNGRRIPIEWQCLDAEGEVLAKGAMRYG